MCKDKVEFLIMVQETESTGGGFTFLFCEIIYWLFIFLSTVPFNFRPVRKGTTKLMSQSYFALGTQQDQLSAPPERALQSCFPLKKTKYHSLTVILRFSLLTLFWLYPDIFCSKICIQQSKETIYMMHINMIYSHILYSNTSLWENPSTWEYKG